MKALSLTFLVLTLGAATPAQTSQGMADAPGVTVTQHRWRQEVHIPALQEDPFRANDEQREWVVAQRQTSRQNAVRERSGQGALPPPPRVIGGHQNANPEDNVRSTVPPPTRTPGRASTQYLYEIKVSNAGTKAIRALVWEYVIFDPETQREVGNHRFLSKESISPGKAKKLVAITGLHPVQVIDAAKGEKQVRSQYTERVLIKRIEYADGTVWDRTAN